MATDDDTDAAEVHADAAPAAPRRKKRKKKASAGPRAAAPIEPLPPWTGPKRTLLASAACACAGIALVGLGPSDLGAVLTLAGLLGLVWGVHTLGRAGLT